MQLRDPSTTSFEGRETTVQLDYLGRVTDIAPPGVLTPGNPGGRAPISLTYDSQGRLATVTSDGGAAGVRTRSFEYAATTGDDNGYLNKVINPLLQETKLNTIDAFGRVLQTERPDGALLSTLFTPGGRLWEVTPPGKTGHEYSYNGFGQISRYSPPQVSPPLDRVKTTYAYRADRTPLLTEQADGSIVMTTYDTHTQRPVQLSWPGGDIQLEYFRADADCKEVGDPDDCFAGALKRVTASDGPVLSFTYDGPLPLSIVGGGTGMDSKLSWDYDSRLRRNVEHLLIGTGTDSPTSVAYDDDSLVTCATFGTSCGGSNALLYTRDEGVQPPLAKDGVLRSAAIGRVKESYGLTPFAELDTYQIEALDAQGQSIAVRYGLDYGESVRDVLGRVTRKKESVDTGGTPVVLTEDYTYDLAGRLKTVERDGLTITYSFDANGNRTLREVRDSADALVESEVGAAADAQDRLLAYGLYTYTYDPRGNLETKKTLAGETTRYEYNALGWLKKVSFQDGTIVEYQYDGLGRRTVKKVNSAITRRYIWNSDLTLAAEVDDAGVVTRYAYGAKRVPELVKKNGVTYKVVSDQLGSIRMLIDVATGDVEFERRYDEYGRILAEAGGASDVTSLGFAGGLYDADTDLVRFGVRDYDSYTGRWTAKDPIGLRGGVNVYEYVEGDPCNAADPTGLRKVSTSEVRKMLDDAIADYDRRGFAGGLDSALDDFQGGGRYDFRERNRGDTFDVDGLGELKPGEFGNYFAGYVGRASFGKLGVWCMHQGGDHYSRLEFDRPDDPLDVYLIDRGGYDASFRVPRPLRLE